VLARGQLLVRGLHRIVRAGSFGDGLKLGQGKHGVAQHRRRLEPIVGRLGLSQAMLACELTHDLLFESGGIIRQCAFDALHWFERHGAPRCTAGANAFEQLIEWRACHGGGITV
jgi:hypothetical protein